jgi:hypothetical protein
MAGFMEQDTRGFALNIRVPRLTIHGLDSGILAGTTGVFIYRLIIEPIC